MVGTMTREFLARLANRMGRSGAQDQVIQVCVQAFPITAHISPAAADEEDSAA